MPDSEQFQHYPVSPQEIWCAAGRIDAAMLPDSDEDARDWLDLPERHRPLLDQLSALIVDVREVEKRRAGGGEAVTRAAPEARLADRST